MGAENSRLLDDDTPPQTLKERSLAAVADLIKDGHVKRIVVMTGAGISTAAGIPDFRSPETGLYHNLARLNLPHAEAVFEIDYFRQNPYPFYMLAKELYPGKFSPTISHVFIALLAKKNLLRMLFTQNIDCLEREAGVPGSHIVEAHGSFAAQHCIDCKSTYPDQEMRKHVEKGEPPRCKCGGLVKPDIVFFGEQLPAAFFENRNVSATADLMLVLGTSLMVQPFASLPLLAMEGVPRVLFNKERVGDLGGRADDVLCRGDCDSGVRKLADELGWRDELEGMWRKIVGEKEAERQQRSAGAKAAEMEDDVDRLVDGVRYKLDLSGKEADGVITNDGQADINKATEEKATGRTEGEKEGIATSEETEAVPKRDESGEAGKTEKMVVESVERAEGGEKASQGSSALLDLNPPVESSGVEGLESRTSEQRQPVGVIEKAPGSQMHLTREESGMVKGVEKPAPVTKTIPPLRTTEEVKGSSVL